MLILPEFTFLSDVVSICREGEFPLNNIPGPCGLSLCIIAIHARFHGIGRIPVLDYHEVTGEGNAAFYEEVDNGDAIDDVNHQGPSIYKLEDEDTDMEEYSSDFAGHACGGIQLGFCCLRCGCRRIQL